MASPGNDDLGQGPVLRAIERIDDRLRAFQEQINNQFAQLPVMFMPRDQLQDRFEALHAKNADLAGAIKDANTRIDVAEAQRTSSVRFVVTTALAALTIAVAALTLIFIIHR